MINVIPSVSLTLKWNPPEDNGCLPVQYYTLYKNGVDISVVITADLTTYTDSITIGGAIGTSITYKLKAINEAGASIYT